MSDINEQFKSLIDELRQILSNKLFILDIDVDAIQGKINKLKELMIINGQESYDYYRGQLDILTVIFEHIKRSNEKCLLIKGVIAKSKQIQSLLLVLNELGMINHQALADALGIKKNYLSNIIKKIHDYGIIQIRYNGKTKIYSLSPYGKKVYQELQALYDAASKVN